MAAKCSSALKTEQDLWQVLLLFLMLLLAAVGSSADLSPEVQALPFALSMCSAFPGWHAMQACMLSAGKVIVSLLFIFISY